MSVTRSSVLKLLAWLVPAQLISLGLETASNVYASRYLFFQHFESQIKSSDFVRMLHFYSNIRLVSSTAFLLSRIVIAVWLAGRRHERRAAAWAWASFGLVGGYWALGLYVLLETRAPDPTEGERPERIMGQ